MPKKSKKPQFDSFLKNFLILFSALGTLVIMCMLFMRFVINQQRFECGTPAPTPPVEEVQEPIIKELNRTYENDFLLFSYPHDFKVIESGRSINEPMNPLTIKYGNSDTTSFNTFYAMNIRLLSEDELTEIIPELFALDVGETHTVVDVVDGEEHPWVRLPDRPVGGANRKMYEYVGVAQSGVMRDIYLIRENLVYVISYKPENFNESENYYPGSNPPSDAALANYVGAFNMVLDTFEFK